MFASLRTFALRSGVTSAVKSLAAPTSVLPVRVGITQSIFSTQSCNFSVFKGIKMNTIKPVPGSKRTAKRVGRGRSSGLGKTSGRGQKGNKARTGLLKLVRYEGGQTMLWRRSPKRGFKNFNRKPLETLNVGTLVKFIAAGRLDGKKVITMKELYESKITGNFKHGIKLLSMGSDLVARLPIPIRLEVTHASASAREAIEKAGGSVKFIYHSPRSIQYLKNPKNMKWVPAPSVPPPKKALRYELQTAGKDGFAIQMQARMARISRRIRKRQL